MSNSQELEEECEELVFNLCYLREHYPEKCATELSKSLKLSSEIEALVTVKSDLKLENLRIPKLSEKEEELLRPSRKNFSTESLKLQDMKIQKMLSKVEELEVIKKEIDREKLRTENKLLEES